MASEDRVHEISRKLAQAALHTHGQPFRLLDLPRELRDKIYCMALKFQLPKKTVYARTGAVVRPTAALLRTCKQILAEAAGVLQRCNPLVRIVTDLDCLDWGLGPDAYATIGLRGPSVLNSHGQTDPNTDVNCDVTSDRRYAKALGRYGNVVMDVVATGFSGHASNGNSDDHELIIALEEFDSYCRELSTYYATLAPKCRPHLTFTIHGGAAICWTERTQAQITSAIVNNFRSCNTVSISAPFRTDDTMALVKGRRWTAVDDIVENLAQRKELGLCAYKNGQLHRAATIWTEAMRDAATWMGEDHGINYGTPKKYLQVRFLLGLNQAAALLEIAKLATTPCDQGYVASVAAMGIALAHASCLFPAWYEPSALLLAKLFFREAVVCKMRGALSAAYVAICEAASQAPKDKVIQAEKETIDALFQECTGGSEGRGDCIVQVEPGYTSIIL